MACEPNALHTKLQWLMLGLGYYIVFNNPNSNPNHTAWALTQSINLNQSWPGD